MEQNLAYSAVLLPCANALIPDFVGQQHHRQPKLPSSKDNAGTISEVCPKTS